MLNKHKGFTLIELLVVISIIGLLSTVVLASLNTARAKSRDATRKENLVNLRSALELYYHDNGHYPLTNATYPTNYYGRNSYVDCPQTWYGTREGYPLTENWIPGLVPNYIAQLPIDPKTSGCNQYLYKTNATGSDYKLFAYLTTEGGNVTQLPWARIAPTCPTGREGWNANIFVVYNRNSGSTLDYNGPECW